MRRLVVHGALLTCEQGAAPCSFSVAPDAGGEAAAMALGTVVHHQPSNVSGFGMCRTQANPAVASATAAAQGVPTPAPCAPVLPAPWSDESGGTVLGGIPVLTSDAELSCAYGGKITITQSGSEVEVA